MRISLWCEFIPWRAGKIRFFSKGRLALTNVKKEEQKMKCKKTLALVLAGTMLLPSGAFAADLSRFNDFPNDWSSGAL